MSDVFAHKQSIIDDHMAGAQAHEKTFLSIELGPTAFEKIDRPAIHILPDRTDYQGGNDYLHVINVLFYFERAGRSEYVDHLETASDATDSILAELKANPLVGEFKINSVADFEGETPGSSSKILLVFVAEIHATTIIDFARSV